MLRPVARQRLGAAQNGTRGRQPSHAQQRRAIYARIPAAADMWYALTHNMICTWRLIEA
jgi:hypothetical protein